MKLINVIICTFLLITGLFCQNTSQVEKDTIKKLEPIFAEHQKNLEDLAATINRSINEANKEMENMLTSNEIELNKLEKKYFNMFLAITLVLIGLMTFLFWVSSRREKKRINQQIKTIIKRIKNYERLPSQKVLPPPISAGATKNETLADIIFQIDHSQVKEYKNHLQILRNKSLLLFTIYKEYAQYNNFSIEDKEVIKGILSVVVENGARKVLYTSKKTDDIVKFIEPVSFIFKYIRGMKLVKKIKNFYAFPW